MCHSTDHAGCRLAALAGDYPSWVITEVAVETEGGTVLELRAVRGGLTVIASDSADGGRFARLRRMLAGYEAGRHAGG